MRKPVRYGVSPLEKIRERNHSKLKEIANQLKNQESIYTNSSLEVYQELLILFYKNFEDYYESDEQYMKFLFICLRNRLRNVRKKDNTYSSRFLTIDKLAGDEEDGGGYLKAWEMFEDSKSVVKVNVISEICKLVDEKTRSFIECVSHGKTSEQIKEELNINHEDLQEMREKIKVLI